MALKVPNQGELAILDHFVAGLSTNCRLRLFRNDYTPIDGSVYGDFTEANFSGYAEATPSFGAATTVSGKGQIADGSARTFTHNGGGTSNTIYGYYVVNQSTSKVLWAERFSSSKPMAVDGDAITITLKFTGASES